jgi:hypothetical protein
MVQEAVFAANEFQVLNLVNNSQQSKTIEKQMSISTNIKEYTTNSKHFPPLIHMQQDTKIESSQSLWHSIF